MKEFFARLNSTERRFVIAVMVVVFIVINVLFVWPRFSDWNAMKIRMAKAEKTFADRDKMISQGKVFDPKVKELERAGQAVPPEDQVNEFLRTITSQAAESGVNIISSSSVRPSGVTNLAMQFFTEQIQSLNIAANETQLVDFLYKLGESKEMIRVRDLALNPDAPHYNLQGNLKLVASYQKKTAIRTTAPATNAPAAKTTAATASPPNPTKK